MDKMIHRISGGIEGGCGGGCGGIGVLGDCPPCPESAKAGVESDAKMVNSAKKQTPSNLRRNLFFMTISSFRSESEPFGR